MGNVPNAIYIDMALSEMEANIADACNLQRIGRFGDARLQKLKFDNRKQTLLEQLGVDSFEAALAEIGLENGTLRRVFYHLGQYLEQERRLAGNLVTLGLADPVTANGGASESEDEQDEDEPSAAVLFSQAFDRLFEEEEISSDEVTAAEAEYDPDTGELQVHVTYARQVTVTVSLD